MNSRSEQSSEATPPSDHPHDMGGQAAGPIERGETDTAHWEWQIDAMVRLALAKGLLSDFAELRDGIEQLTAQDYNNLTYYERWARALAYALESKGTISAQAVKEKVHQIALRQEHTQ